MDKDEALWELMFKVIKDVSNTRLHELLCQLRQSQFDRDQRAGEILGIPSTTPEHVVANMEILKKEMDVLLTSMGEHYFDA